MRTASTSYNPKPAHPPMKKAAAAITLMRLVPTPAEDRPRVSKTSGARGAQLHRKFLQGSNAAFFSTVAPSLEVGRQLFTGR